MTEYWVKNEDGTVLGPVSLKVLRDIAASGQLVAVTHVSTDGRTWQARDALQEMRALLSRSMEERPPDAPEADRIRAAVAAARGRPAYEVFGVAEGAPLDDFRAAFFAKVKRYHPHRLPKTASEDMRAACGEMFKLLSDLMLAIQSGQAQATAATKRSVAAPPTFQADEFVGLRPIGANRLEADLLVGMRTADLFTAHKLVNVSTNGFFICGKTYPLGMSVDVHLRFEGEDRTFSARGRVVLESAGSDPRQPCGTGVQMSLSTAERAFLQSFIGDVVARRQQQA